MPERMPPDDDPIIRGIRAAGIRPLPPRPIAGEVHPPHRRRRIALALIVVVALLFFVPTLASRLSDWLWYREVGFERVFFTKIVAQWALGIPTGLIAFALLYTSARIAIAGDARVAIESRVRDMYGRAGMADRARATVESTIRVVSIGGTAFVALLFALFIAAQWRTILQFVYRTPFGVADPVFGRDVGYYVFTLPVIELATGAATWLLVLALVIALPFHLARVQPGLGWRPLLQGRGHGQIAVLVALLLVVTAVRIHFVQIPGLLFGDHLPLTGARYVDLHVRIPALHVLSLAALVGGLAIVWAGTRGRLVAMTGRVVVAWLVIVLLAAVVPAVVQQLS